MWRGGPVGTVCARSVAVVDAVFVAVEKSTVCREKTRSQFTNATGSKTKLKTCTNDRSYHGSRTAHCRRREVSVFFCCCRCCAAWHGSLALSALALVYRKMQCRTKNNVTQLTRQTTKNAHNHICSYFSSRYSR